MSEYYFGPVLSIFPFDNEDEMIEMANNVRYILAAAIWSKDPERVKRVAGKLNTGYIWYNNWYIRDMSMPFGGLLGRGLGRSGEDDVVEYYTQAKTLSIP